MSPKARPAFSATLSQRRPPRAANFFQAFSKFFANFRRFSASFSKFLFGGFGGFQRVKGQKICETVAFRSSPNFCPPLRGKFSHKEPLPPTAAADGRGGSRCQTAEMHSTTDFEKQKDICDCRHLRLLLLGDGGRPSRRGWRSLGDGAPRKQRVVRRGDDDREARQAGALPLWAESSHSFRLLENDRYLGFQLSLRNLLLDQHVVIGADISFRSSQTPSEPGLQRIYSLPIIARTCSSGADEARKMPE